MPEVKTDTCVTHGQEDTFALGRALGGCLSRGDCVLLSGDLGTGKSVLARGIAGALGIEGPMPSPSFTILIPYEGTMKLYHYDLYRLADPDEFYAAGLDEFLGGDGVCVIEWPEMAELELVPAVDVRIERGAAEDERRIFVCARGIARENMLWQALTPWREKSEDTGD